MKENKIQEIRFSLYNILRGNTSPSTTYLHSILACYILVKHREKLSDFNNDDEMVYYNSFNIFDQILDKEKLEDRRFYLNELFKNINLKDLQSMLIFSNEDLIDYILNSQIDDSRGGFETTPISLIKLSLKILQIKDNEIVGDLCAGTGTFGVFGLQQHPKANFIGFDINTEVRVIAQIRSEFLENFSVVESDVLRTDSNNILFNKAFSNYPFGLNTRYLDNKLYIDHLIKKLPSLSKATSADWLFNYKLINSIKTDGLAIGIMSSGGTWNTIDKPIREYFIKMGWINTVISLPERMFNTTGIPTTMIVFSHNNKSVNFVDAKEICVKERRTNYFSEENINVILNAIQKSGDISKNVPLSEIVKQDFNLNPVRYLEKNIIIDGVLFKDLIEEISRGASLNASDLDLLATNEITNYRYLMLSNIKNGLIDEDLNYIKEVDNKNKKYCLKNNDFLISKMGMPFKMTVYERNDDNLVLANGNLFIVRLKTEKIDPYYLQSFFESELGYKVLQNISAGTTIPTLGKNQLENLLIPLPTIEKQKEIALKYRAVLDEIKLLNRKLLKAENALKNIWGEE